MNFIRSIKMIRLMIFDLDNTLLDTYHYLSRPLFSEMLKKMKEVGMTDEQEKQLIKQYKFTGFKPLAEKIGISKKIIKAGLSAYKTMDLSGVTPYSDVKVLESIACEKMIVSSGLPEVQNEKIKILGIMHIFSKARFDPIIGWENKFKIFKSILQENKFKPNEIMVLGDNPDAEILAGNKLGMVTVQVMRHKGMQRGNASYHINDFHELKKILQNIA